MEKVNWSKRSINSLNKIWKFYAENISIEVADKFIHEIIVEAETIVFTSQYQVEELIGKGYRRAIIRHFKVIYKADGKIIRIYNIFDSRQNPKKLNR